MNYNMSFCTKSIKSLDVWVFLLKLIKSAVLPDKVDNPLSGCWTDCLIINHDDLVPWDQFAFWWTPCQNKPKKDLMVQTLHGPTFFFFCLGPQSSNECFLIEDCSNQWIIDVNYSLTGFSS